MRLENKVALVTAAGQGIGRAIADAFAREGARVYATDIDTHKLSDLKVAGTLAMDVRDPQKIASVVNAIGPVDILVNCAGFVETGTILDSGEEQWLRSLDINLTGMVRTIRAVLPGMLAAGGGSIVNIASVVSSIKAAPNRCVYATTKAAVIGLTKSVAIDFIGRGIRCNAICPGTIDTPSLGERVNAQANRSEARQAFIDRQPMKRLGTPEEVAAVAVYLASDESRFMTGSTPIVDGGFSL
jgi:2-keto-3-deoxy-L-fuconate dehydrogenase